MALNDVNPLAYQPLSDDLMHIRIVAEKFQQVRAELLRSLEGERARCRALENRLEQALRAEELAMQAAQRALVSAKEYALLDRVVTRLKEDNDKYKEELREAKNRASVEADMSSARLAAHERSSKEAQRLADLERQAARDRLQEARESLQEAFKKKWDEARQANEDALSALQRELTATRKEFEERCGQLTERIGVLEGEKLSLQEQLSASGAHAQYVQTRLAEAQRALAAEESERVRLQEVNRALMLQQQSLIQGLAARGARPRAPRPRLPAPAPRFQAASTLYPPPPPVYPQLCLSRRQRAAEPVEPASPWASASAWASGSACWNHPQPPEDVAASEASLPPAPLRGRRRVFEAAELVYPAAPEERAAAARLPRDTAEAASASARPLPVPLPVHAHRCPSTSEPQMQSSDAKTSSCFSFKRRIFKPSSASAGAPVGPPAAARDGGSAAPDGGARPPAGEPAAAPTAAPPSTPIAEAPLPAAAEPAPSDAVSSISQHDQSQPDAEEPTPLAGDGQNKAVPPRPRSAAAEAAAVEAEPRPSVAKPPSAPAVAGEAMTPAPRPAAVKGALQLPPPRFASKAAPPTFLRYLSKLPASKMRWSVPPVKTPAPPAASANRRKVTADERAGELLQQLGETAAPADQSKGDEPRVTLPAAASHEPAPPPAAAAAAAAAGSAPGAPLLEQPPAAAGGSDETQRQRSTEPANAAQPQMQLEASPLSQRTQPVEASPETPPSDPLDSDCDDISICTDLSLSAVYSVALADSVPDTQPTASSPRREGSPSGNSGVPDEEVVEARSTATLQEAVVDRVEAVIEAVLPAVQLPSSTEVEVQPTSDEREDDVAVVDANGTTGHVTAAASASETSQLEAEITSVSTSVAAENDVRVAAAEEEEAVEKEKVPEEVETAVEEEAAGGEKVPEEVAATADIKVGVPSPLITWSSHVAASEVLAEAPPSEGASEEPHLQLMTWASYFPSTATQTAALAVLESGIRSTDADAASESETTLGLERITSSTTPSASVARFSSLECSPPEGGAPESALPSADAARLHPLQPVVTSPADTDADHHDAEVNAASSLPADGIQSPPLSRHADEVLVSTTTSAAATPHQDGEALAVADVPVEGSSVEDSVSYSPLSEPNASPTSSRSPPKSRSPREALELPDEVAPPSANVSTQCLEITSTTPIPGDSESGRAAACGDVTGLSFLRESYEIGCSQPSCSSARSKLGSSAKALMDSLKRSGSPPDGAAAAADADADAEKTPKRPAISRRGQKRRRLLWSLDRFDD